MKLRAQKEGFAVVATVVTANLAKDTLVKITADNTVDKADANAHAIGRLVVPSKTANGTGTVETRYKERIEIKVATTVTAGQFAKLGAPDGTTGENTIAPWVSGTDVWERNIGVVIKGATNGNVAEVLLF
jgi:hypothetical protein